MWVNTGSDIPSWSNAVLMVEDSSLDGDMLLINKTLTNSANVRPLGGCHVWSDYCKRGRHGNSGINISIFVCRHRRSACLQETLKLYLYQRATRLLPKKNGLQTQLPKPEPPLRAILCLSKPPSKSGAMTWIYRRYFLIMP